MFSTIYSILQLSWQETTVAPAFAGVLAHHTFFRPYEIDGAAWQLIFIHLSLLITLCVAYVHIAGFTVIASLLRTLLVANSYIVSLTASTLIYRAFFHRLRRFPGPLGARLSRFYAFYRTAKNVRGCEDIQKLHVEYGDFVRVGPREISINRPSGIRHIYDPPVRTTRSPWYAQVSDDVTKISLNSTRILKVHKQRKKVWERGLGYRAMARYEPRIMQKVDLLLSKIAANARTTMNVTEYMMFFGFDVMGEVGFSKDFQMIENESEHNAIKGIHESMMAIGVFGTAPWLLSMVGKIPGVARGYSRFTRWCHDQLQEKRRTMISERATFHKQEPRDVISWLLMAKEDGDPCAPPGDRAVEEDARLLIIAGSDTVASAITNALYYLVKNPDSYKTLQKRLYENFPRGDGDWTYEKARAIPYLTHVIYETLRLRPPIPGGLARVTPPEGLMVDGIFIPGNIVTSVPTYTIQRDERYWADAQSFKPERWGKISTEKAPWIPFTRGQWACVGKSLAMMEMRMVLGRIALQYDISFPMHIPAGTVKFDFKDTFTQTLPPLPLVFTPSPQIVDLS